MEQIKMCEAVEALLKGESISPVGMIPCCGCNKNLPLEGAHFLGDSVYCKKCMDELLGGLDSYGNC